MSLLGSTALRWAARGQGAGEGVQSGQVERPASQWPRWRHAGRGSASKTRMQRVVTSICHLLARAVFADHYDGDLYNNSVGRMAVGWTARR